MRRTWTEGTTCFPRLWPGEGAQTVPSHGLCGRKFSADDPYAFRYSINGDEVNCLDCLRARLAAWTTGVAPATAVD